MRDTDDGSCVLLQVLLQPIDGLGVQVVGRLVEQQHVGLLQQQTAERYTTTLTSGESSHTRIIGRTTQCVHCTV